MMTISNKRVMALVAAGLLLPALAGCSRSSEDPPVPVENDTPAVEENMAMPEDTPVMTNAVEAAPVNMAEAAAPPPPPERSQDQQMMDDASATGMTARVQRTPGDAPADETTTPKDGQ